jgi:hypothetical protein
VGSALALNQCQKLRRNAGYLKNRRQQEWFMSLTVVDMLVSDIYGGYTMLT